MSTVRVPADVVALIRRGISAIVASRDAQLRPSLMRAVGADAAPDGSTVTVFLSRPQSRQLIQDIAASGHISVVFSEPSTHRAIQLKATKATQRNAGAGDEPLLARYLRAMEHELAVAGYSPEFTRAMFGSQHDDVVAITFAPEQAFEQTPGPRAGTRLEGA